jgi:DNA topoisomerase-1
MLKLGRKNDNEKYSAEELAVIPIDNVKKMIEQQLPDAFIKKAAKKTASPKKAAAKKAASKKSAKKK